jgi:hypothetical protein
MQRIQGKELPGQAQFLNQLPSRRQFMGFVGAVDQYMSQDQRPICGQGAEYL